MPRFLATYDLQGAHPDPHSAFKSQARTCGWSDWIVASNGHQYKLPNTTLVGDFENIQTAQNQFFLAVSKTVALRYSVTVEKWIIVEYGNAKFNSDEMI
jgi:hypothetical protein